MGSNVWKLVLVTATREFVFISEAIPKPQHGLNRNANLQSKCAPPLRVHSRNKVAGNVFCIRKEKVQRRLEEAINVQSIPGVLQPFFEFSALFTRWLSWHASLYLGQRQRRDEHLFIDLFRHPRISAPWTYLSGRGQKSLLPILTEGWRHGPGVC